LLVFRDTVYNSVQPNSRQTLQLGRRSSIAAITSAGSDLIAMQRCVTTDYRPGDRTRLSDSRNRLLMIFHAQREWTGIQAGFA